MKLLLALIYSLLSLLGGGNYRSSEAIPGPLNDYRNRSFDPATGRFLQRDPVIGGDPLYNPYVFPGNNPINRMDPMGLGFTDWAIDLWKHEIKPIAVDLPVQ
jgi:RHS repeat-associated protein